MLYVSIKYIDTKNIMEKNKEKKAPVSPIWKSVRWLLLLIIIAISSNISCTSDNEKKAFNEDELILPEILKDGNSNYLPDFSYAGYKWGEEPLPTPSGSIFNVIDFGAVPNDGIDDTVAILNAVDAASSLDKNTQVIVKFPAGRFILKEIVFITRGNFILLGAGSDSPGTTIYIPEPLKNMTLPEMVQDDKKKFEAEGRTTGSGAPYSYFSWIGGVIWTYSDKKPYYPNKFLVSGKRGSHTIIVDDDDGNDSFFRDKIVGNTFFLRWYNNGRKDSDLVKHILDNQDVEVGDEYENFVNGVYQPYTLVSQTVTATSINGNILTIKEKLAHDLRTEWIPKAGEKNYKIAFNTDFDGHQGNYYENVGIEGFTFEFPETTYPGHHEEDGYNAIYMTRLLHSWARDIKVTNSDSGILCKSLKFVTLDNIEVDGRSGHYTVSIESSSYVLIKNFNFLAKALHNPSFNSSTFLNVYTNGFIMEPQFDQHMGMNHQNLFDNISSESDDVKNLFDHGGNIVRGPTAGAFNTFWNIYVASDTTNTTEIDDAPSARIVGLHGSSELELTYGPNAYIEKLNENDLTVPSLYEYQLKKRLQ